MTSTLSLASILAEQARRRPTKTAVIEPGRSHTYAELWQRSRAVARHLQETHGAGPRVALMAFNSADFVVGYYGILAAGGTVVPVPTLLGPDRAAGLITRAGAVALLGHDSTREAAELAAQVARVPYSDVDALTHVDPIGELVATRPDDTAVIFFTSGTTGVPKGAKLSHLNLVMNATVNAFDNETFFETDVVMGSLPLFHTFGQSVALNATFRVGATLVLHRRFDSDAAWRAMVDHGVTLFFGVPTMLIHLLEVAQNSPRARPELRYCISGGAPLPMAVLEKFERELGAPIFEGYGLSETSPTAAVNQSRFAAKPGSVGHGIWGVDVRVCDASNEASVDLIGAGEIGEIVIRGHNVFSGYLDDAVTTASAVQDGWFRTGDLGTWDETGRIRIVDRLKDLIIRGGYNVYPREIEEVLMRRADVVNAAVVGLPDDISGEEICAVIVPAPGAARDADEVRAWAEERLGRHQYPRIVEFVDELPEGPSHKVLKRELRDMYSHLTDRN